MRLSQITNVGPAKINEIIQIYENFNTLNEGKKDVTKPVDELYKILINEHPDYKGVTYHIRGQAFKDILNTKNKRVYTTVISLLTDFRDFPKPFEHHFLQSGKMRGHRIKVSKKPDKEYQNQIKVDILGKTLGMLFHSGPKDLPSGNYSENEIYIVAFGDHGDLGT